MSDFVLMSNETLPGEMAIQPARAFEQIWSKNGWVEEARGTELEMRQILNPPKVKEASGEELEAPPVEEVGPEYDDAKAPIDGPLSGKKSAKEDSQNLEE